ncbi:PL29 family lyase N-terminal domain-containing protein [Leeuwenhoekiella sp. H156]|uniref:PL29 family lyase N-terminal domain-containing protein n=1 Tax=Leeuwenhoekiella sp. H156 TaxID=3450128 RepID=UPI003FA4CD59
MMRRNIVLLALVFFCFNSCVSELREDLDNLRREVNAQAQILEALQANLSITGVEEDTNGYRIVFSDGSAINLEDGKTPIIKIGASGNWFVDGVDTGVNAMAQDGMTPTVEIGNSGNWIINGTDTGTAANGVEGADAPRITAIVQTLTGFQFDFSDGSILKVPYAIGNKRIACWGDSLTAGNQWPVLLQNILGATYSIVNCGVGGENSLTIGARQGGLPMYIDKPFVFPEDTEELILGDYVNPPFMSLHTPEADVRPLLQGGFSTVNSCKIGGIECILRWTGTSWNDADGKYTIQRKYPGESYSVPAQSLVFTSSMRELRNLYANIYFIGQNGGFSSPDDLVAQYKKIAEFSGSADYIIIGLHKAGSVSRMKAIETAMQAEFGARFINLRRYLASNALRDGGYTPTPEDLFAMEMGECPPQFLSDGVHFNEKGNRVIANLTYQRMLDLGMSE